MPKKVVMKEIDNIVGNKLSVESESSQSCFVIEFNENGSPLDCHKVQSFGYRIIYKIFQILVY